MFRQACKRSLILFLIMTLLCGVIYTMVITGIAQLLFKEKANGSKIEVDDVEYGSELLGQQYDDESHMWGRIMLPDVTTYKNEKGEPLLYAKASNKSPASKEYQEEINRRVAMIREANPQAETKDIPVELVTCSGSGLDPHISKAAAEYQVPRIAAENGMTEDEVRDIIKKHTTGRLFGILGEETVNVLKVNLELEGVLP